MKRRAEFSTPYQPQHKQQIVEYEEESEFCATDDIQYNADYDICEMAHILAMEDTFFESNKLKTIEVVATSEDYCIKSVMSNTENIFASIHSLTLKDLNAQFPQGHTLALVTNSNYFLPLFIDCDHIPCEKRHDCKQFSSNHLITLNFIESIFNTIMSFLDPKRTYRPSDINKNCYVQTHNCGIHIYINCKVSVIVYPMILSLLQSTLGEVSQYKFDSITTMPLPFSTKNINTGRYETFNNRFTHSDIINNKQKAYDVKLYTHFKPQRQQTLLASITNQNMAAFDDDWLKLQNTATEYLSTDLEIIESTTIPNCITRFGSDCVSSDNKYLIEYLKKIDHTQSSYFNFNMMTTIGPDEIPEEILHATSELSVVICKTLKVQFLQSDENQVSSFRYIYRLMVAPEETCGYTLYVMCAYINYLCKTTSITLPEAVHILGHFLKCIIHIDSAPCFYVVDETYRSLLKFNAFQQCCDIFRDGTCILRYLSVMEYYGHKNGDSFSKTIERVIKLEIDDQATEDIITSKVEKLILPYFFFVLKASTKATDVYVYDMTKFNHILNIHDEKYLNLYCNYGALTSIMAKWCRKFMKKNDLVTIIKDAWNQYASNICVRPITNGKYKFFINTDLGIFCNITGFYMMNVPFLQFQTRQCKQYATLSDIRQTDTDVVNCFSTINDASRVLYATFDAIMSRISLINYEIYHLAILIPGLLTFQNIYGFSMVKFDTLMKQIIKSVCHGRTATSNHMLFIHFRAVMIAYPIDPDIVMALAYILNHHVDLFSPSQLEILLREFASSGTNIGEFIQEKKHSALIDDDCYTMSMCGHEIILHILSNYDDIEIAEESFVLAYIYIIFSSYHGFDLIPTLFVKKYLHFSNFIELQQPLLNNTTTTNPDESFLSIDDLSNYSLETDINTMRALKIVFGKNIPHDILHALSSLYKMFGFQTQVLLDYLAHHALLYQPWNENRKFLNYRGPPACGKSKLITAISNFHGPGGCYPMNSKIRANQSTEAPSPVLINALRAYFTPIKEASNVDADVIKIATGEDAISLRLPFLSDTSTIEPLSFIVCVSNRFPKIKADQAIKTRIVIFRMSYSFHDITEIPIEEQNSLILFSQKKNVKIPIQDRLFAMGLSNMFYAAFRFFRNSAGMVVPKIINTESIHELEEFMKANNMVYRIMADAKIIIKPGTEISIQELTNAVNIAITNLHSNKKLMAYTTDDFFDEFKEIYESHEVKQRGKIIQYNGICIISPSDHYNNVPTTDNLILRACKNVDNPQCILLRSSIIQKLNESNLSATKKAIEYENFMKRYLKFFVPSTKDFCGIELVD
jgi:hypothetical protein